MSDTPAVFSEHRCFPTPIRRLFAFEALQPFASHRVRRVISQRRSIVIPRCRQVALRFLHKSRLRPEARVVGRDSGSLKKMFLCELVLPALHEKETGVEVSDAEGRVDL